MRDPFTGRASMVRGMVERSADAGGDPAGVPERPQLPSFGDLERAGGDALQGRGRSASRWRSLGEAFRGRDAESDRRAAAASARAASLTPALGKYEHGQQLFDLLRGFETAADPDLAAQIAALRAEIPTVESDKFMT